MSQVALVMSLYFPKQRALDTAVTRSLACKPIPRRKASSAAHPLDIPYL